MIQLDIEIRSLIGEAGDSHSDAYGEQQWLGPQVHSSRLELSTMRRSLDQSMVEFVKYMAVLS